MTINYLLNNEIILTLVCIILIIGLLYSLHKLIELVILKYAEWVAYNHHEWVDEYKHDYNYINDSRTVKDDNRATKVEKSDINGNVIINGVETTVFDYFDFHNEEE